ncbi:MAG: 50S ribosomal protein L24e [Nanoarchaeota archaeon]
MVNCTFCGYAIRAGTGKMLVLKDGKIQYFCKMKCEKNLHKLGRKPRTTEWTRAYALQKAADIAAAKHAKTEGQAPAPAAKPTKTEVKAK